MTAPGNAKRDIYRQSLNAPTTTEALSFLPKKALLTISVELDLIDYIRIRYKE